MTKFTTTRYSLIIPARSRMYCHDIGNSRYLMLAEIRARNIDNGGVFSSMRVDQ